MSRLVGYFRIFLVIVTVLYAGAMVRDAMGDLSSANGLLQADGTSPVGGDFINAYSAGVLAGAGQVDRLYDPDAFMAFERTLVPANIGLRLWAYPPTSLPLVVPFGLVPYHLGLAAWSLVGLALLALGARRVGLNWLDTGLLVLSPAALSSVYFGQTGNAAIGLLLIALGVSRRIDASSALAATVLTVKPQLGLLLPVLWAIHKHFALIAATCLMVAAFAGVSVLIFGWQAWLDYAFKTLPVLNDLERNGGGAFLDMIPSVFIALRIVIGDAGPAQWVHLAVAALVLVWSVWRLGRMKDDAAGQAALLLIATALLTPYIHIYDLAGVFAAGLLHLRRAEGFGLPAQLAAGLVVLAGWALPMITLLGNMSGVPVGPLVLLGMLAVLSAR